MLSFCGLIRAQDISETKLKAIRDVWRNGAATFGQVDALIAPGDYTFKAAKAHVHGDPLTFECKFMGRTAALPLDNGADQFFGNVLLVTTQEDLPYDGATDRYWVDWSGDLWESERMIAMLYSAKTIRLTVDPVCRLVLKIEIVSFR